MNASARAAAACSSANVTEASHLFRDEYALGPPWNLDAFFCFVGDIASVARPRPPQNIMHHGRCLRGNIHDAMAVRQSLSDKRLMEITDRYAGYPYLALCLPSLPLPQGLNWSLVLY
jgi:hypothetical protein